MADTEAPGAAKRHPDGREMAEEFDPARYDQGTRMKFLEAKVAYLLDEVSGLRTLVRHLVSERAEHMPVAGQTRASFNYQWKSLPEGHAMLSNAEFRERVPKQMCEFADLPPEWFRGKKVMDAGCGQGRWTYGLGKLGVEKCVSFDISEAGVARTTKIAREFGDRMEVHRKNILEPLGFPADFDLVWCFGVLHHTGKTYVGFQNLVQCVKPGGYLFVMIYGEPRPGYPADYGYYHEMFEMRSRLRNLPFEEKVAAIEGRYGKELLHGYFDAISPDINDLYRWDELVSWFVAAGFTDIKRTDPGTNHHIVARRKE
ncbi:MAG: class I SAM-dependent methyltransferase [Acidobacteriota bacterium]|nr:class I SAM-dependent methyltransferase [Acidobacteriota bacterium]